MAKEKHSHPASVRARVEFRPGDRLTDRDPADISLAPGDHLATAFAEKVLLAELAVWQERLYAEGLGGGRRALLLLLQGMDTSGKDSTIRRVVGGVNPAGVRITSFKKPTVEELAHDFLWRVERQLPAPGGFDVFNRSHYEDVLVVRVHNLVPAAEWTRRYGLINEFEQRVVDSGCHIVKVMLHISKAEQRRRLGERLNDPVKQWKYSPADLAERELWDEYQLAYQAALTTCSTDAAPWYVVPADHKWSRDWIIANLLVDAMRDMQPQYPPPNYDVAEQKRLLAASD